DPRWVSVPWALYTLLTALIFHVELRYRLPLCPVLLPYAAWALARVAGRRSQVTAPAGATKVALSPRHLLAAVTCLALLALTLLHQPYLSESWMLARKHAQLWQAERSLAGGDASGATSAATAALALDPDSALAHVALARAALIGGEPAPALAELD